MEEIIFKQKQEEIFFIKKDSLEEKSEKKAETTIIKNTKKIEKQSEKTVHNSLQHESSVSVPLLTALVDALKKESAEDISETLETITKEETETQESDEKKKAKKDSALELAEKIKRLYTNELKEQMYNKSLQANYTANSMQYQNDASVQMQNGVKAAYAQESYDNSKKVKTKMDDENSTGYKASGGSKYQAFVMTDPKGRWHSTWEVVRVINETYDGKIERNDGLHYQGL